LFCAAVLNLLRVLRKIGMYDFRREIEPNTPCEFSRRQKKKSETI